MACTFECHALFPKKYYPHEAHAFPSTYFLANCHKFTPWPLRNNHILIVDMISLEFAY